MKTKRPKTRNQVHLRTKACPLPLCGCMSGLKHKNKAPISKERRDGTCISCLRMWDATRT